MYKCADCGTALVSGDDQFADAWICTRCNATKRPFLPIGKVSNPAPVPNESTPIWDLVIADMKARDQVGRQRYGTPLQAHNGRDALQDAYEEALDLAVYLRQAIEERKSRT